MRRETRSGLATLVLPPRAKRAAGTLLYVHGLGESSRCFSPVLEHQALGDWRHVCVDLPGYGESQPAPRPLTLAELIEVVKEWIGRELQSEHVLLGHAPSLHSILSA